MCVVLVFCIGVYSCTQICIVLALYTKLLERLSSPQRVKNLFCDRMFLFEMLNCQCDTCALCV